MLSERLQKLKNQCNMSTQKISEVSGHPVPTLNKIFRGETPNPAFQTVVDICTAMGFTVDALLYPEAGEAENFTHPSQKPLDDRMERQFERLLEEKERQIEAKQQRIEDLKEAGKLKNRWIGTLVAIVACLTAFIIIWLICDMLHPMHGLVQK